MKKVFYYALAGTILLGSGMEMSAVEPFQKGKTPPRHRVASGMSRQIAKAPTASTVIEEDFSRFSDGSEEAPGEIIVNPNGSYILSSDMTAQPGWRGLGLRPAGGCVLVAPYLYDDGYGDGPMLNDGYISTPATPLGGTATLTFKAKAKKAGSELWVSICDDYNGPSDSEDFYPTEEWKEYTFVTTEGALDEESYFQFRPTSLGEVFIDDIKVDFVRDRIQAPYGLPATNVSSTEFIANWEETGAPEYLLSVYSIIPDVNPIVGTISENFDGITPDAADKNIPEGWTMEFDGKAMTGENGQFYSAPQAFVFDSEKDLIVSPKSPYPLNHVSFWVKPSAWSDSDSEMSLLRVEVYGSDTDTWTPIAHIPYYYTQQNGGFYEFTADALGTDATAVKMILVQKGNVDFYVDNIDLSYASTGTRKDILVDSPVTSSGVSVKGIDPTGDTYYYVKASEDGLVSPPSYKIWVDGITGLQPAVSEATDVTPVSFTANWEPLGHATDYKVETYKFTYADKDMDDVLVLEESFDNIDEGTLQNPGYDWVSPFDFSSKGWASTGWCASEPAWIKGMAGTRGTSWIGTAGLVYSPLLDLSCNGGEGFDVEITVCTTVANLSELGIPDINEPEGVFAMVLRSPTDNQAIASGLLETPVKGMNSGKIHVDTRGVEDLSKVYVALMNKSGTAFYVDHVRITQSLRKGEELRSPLSIITTGSTSATFDGLDPRSDHGYVVTASTSREYTSYVSLPSEMQIVRTSTGIGNVAVGSDSSATATASNGAIVIEASDSTAWNIFTPAGILVKSGRGQASVDTTPGIYIVSLGTHTVKLLVK